MSGTASSLPAVLPPEGTDPAVAYSCQNCGAHAPGKFCSNCGQTTAVHMPTLGEFLHELISHHIALEGTLVATLKRLIFTPGGLTLDFFAGKRARYVAPLRLYLTFNVVFFLALELGQVLGAASGQDADAKKALAHLHVKDATAAIAQASAEIDADKDMSPEQRRAATQELDVLRSFASRAALPDDATSPPESVHETAAESSAATNALSHPAAAAPSETSGSGSSPSTTSAATTSPSTATPSTSAASTAPPSTSTSSPSSAPATNSASSVTAPSVTSPKISAHKHAGPNVTFSIGTPADQASTHHPFPGVTVTTKPSDDDDEDDTADKAADAKSDQDDARQEVVDSVKDVVAAATVPTKLQMADGTPLVKSDARYDQWKKFEDAVIPGWVDRHAPSVRAHLDLIPSRPAAQTTQRLKENILRYAPYTVLMLVPVCAFLLQLSFVGCHRGYVENLVSSLHGHTFLFIVLLLFLLPLGGWLSTLLFVLATIHIMVALSRIYGSRYIGLLLRLGFLAVTYGIAFSIATAGALIVSILT